MTVFISGGAKNGKSSLAQDLAVLLSKGGALYYVATMIPADSEDEDRIRRHIADRDGMGFETVECGRDILSCLTKADKNGTFLLDSATALLMNELFRTYFPPEAYELVVKELSQKFHATVGKTKTIYDCCSCFLCNRYRSYYCILCW